MSWSALSSLVAMPFGQLSPRKSESRACYLTNVAADKRSSGCAWLRHALLLPRFGVEEALAITKQVAGALEYAHQHEGDAPNVSLLLQDRQHRPIYAVEDQRVSRDGLLTFFGVIYIPRQCFEGWLKGMAELTLLVSGP
jgi:hypothetical protein